MCRSISVNHVLRLPSVITETQNKTRSFLWYGIRDKDVKRCDVKREGQED